MINSKVAIAVVVLLLSVLFAIIDTDILLFVYDKVFVNPTKLRTKFEGKRVWVTGASSGIGADLATQLASHGANVILSGRRKNKLNDLAAKLSTTYQVQTQVVSFDLKAERAVIDAAVAEVLDVGSVDVLILNAGVLYEVPALDTPISTTLEIMKVNFEAPVQIATELARRDRWTTTDKKDQSHVVVVSSGFGKLPAPYLSSYAASKHALNGFFLTWGIENGDKIRIGIVMPGPVTTNIHRTTLKEEGHAFWENIPFSISSERCARLILSSMIGPEMHSFEVWIGNNVALLYVYISHYFPIIGRVAVKIVARLHSMYRQNELRLW